MIVTIIPTDLVTNSLLSLFCPFLETNNKIKFSRISWSGNQKYFCFLCNKRVVLYFKAMPNSIDFIKGIFFHDISLRIIVPWFR